MSTMTAKEAADILRPIFGREKGMSTGEYQTAKTWTAIYALVRAYLEQNPAASDDGWRLIDNESPAGGSFVLVGYWKYGVWDMCVAVRSQERDRFAAVPGYYGCKPTHWMRLPNPPRIITPEKEQQ